MEPVSEGVGRCRKCLAVVDKTKCVSGSAARFVIGSPGGEKHTVVNEIVTGLVEKSAMRDDMCPEIDKILFTPEMTFTVPDGVVKSIEGPDRAPDRYWTADLH